MLVEVTERLGPSIDWWIEQPHALTMAAFHELQDRDHRDQWIARMMRIEAAELTAIAFHDPKRLATERRAAIADAGTRGGGISDDEISRAREMLERFERSGVMADTPEQIAEHYRKYPRAEAVANG